MMVTVRTMRNAAALYVEDVYVHLHIKVFVILMLGSPTDTFVFFFKSFLNAKHLNLVHSTISNTWLFKIRINNTWNTTLSKSKTVVHALSFVMYLNASK